MRRHLLAATFLIAASPAWAGPMAAVSAPSLPTNNPTATGTLTAPTVNLTGLTPITNNSLNLIHITAGVPFQEGVFVGPRAGNVMPNSTPFGGVGIGNSALRFANTAAEATCGGSYACEFLTTAYAVTGWGEHVIGFDNSSYASAFGNDAMRDTIGAVNSTAIGSQSMRDGTGGNNTALGAFSLQGNAGGIHITGTLTVGDVLKAAFTTTNASVTGLPATASYTVKSGDTLDLASQGLAASIAALGVTFTMPDGNTMASENGVSFGAFTTGTPGWIAFHFPGGNTLGWAITPTTSCVGTCGEVLTTFASFTGSDNIAIGINSMLGAGLTTAQQNVAIGTQTFAALNASSSSNIAIGFRAGYAATTASTNVIIGANAALNMTSANDNVVVGNQAGVNITTGGANTLIGGKNQGSSPTTGSGNVAIGYGATIQSATAGWQLSIQNMIWGTGNSVGAGGGYGYIGIGAPAPNATLTVGDPTGGHGAHLGFLQTAKPGITGCTGCTLDATASDSAGTLTEGTSQTGFVLTWEVAFATVPHCVVTSPTGSAFTSYTPTTTGLTVANASQSAAQYTYACVQ